MKKHFPKKLQLKKISLVALQAADQYQVRGGAPTTTKTSISCPGNEECFSGIIPCQTKAPVCQ
ncbi:class I lanthipeptide [Chitinophaga solisilvae]|uniref:Uncharacterized protein n=1 Tax=Chitinophaga solisilvae TaxID=1233460 RepID=A0A433WPZ4_9BACT|nr:class I lanthipeptide [Chitinophaga solisilvae]NSL86972.1 hypothetical protein [Chitinophaga solisilvae]